jgi:hypothetical protein
LNDVKIVDFSISGNAVQGYWGDAGLYVEFLLHSDFDIVTNFASYQWVGNRSDMSAEKLQKFCEKIDLTLVYQKLYSLAEGRGL